LRGTGKTNPGDAETIRYLDVLEAQRLIDFCALRLAPAAAAGALLLAQTNDIVCGALIFATVLLFDSAISRLSYPLHLMPLSRALLVLLAPVAAALVVYSVEPGVQAMSTDALAVSVIGSCLISALGVWVAANLRDVRKVPLAVVGDERFARNLAAELEQIRPAAFNVAGWLGSEPISPAVDSPPWLGDVSDACEVFAKHGIELVVHAPMTEISRPRTADVQEQLAASCLETDARLIWANQFCEDVLGHVPLGATNAAWFRYLMHPRYRAGSVVGKRAFDLVVGTLLAVAAAPLLAVAAIAIHAEGGGPALYRQRRIGQRGREFEMFKLRTMRRDAEREGPQWSGDDDDRVTRVGRFLRRTHIDELPQLLNVLRGEMSLVGPRPERPEWAASLRDEVRFYDRRHLAKPGMTGWAQVRCGYSGSTSGTAFKLCHDLYYLKYRSVPRDLLIMFETIVVLTKKILFVQPAIEPSPLTSAAATVQAATVHTAPVNGFELDVPERRVDDADRVLDADLA
jgi:exopolysaccharide biosynthesis polyprenyl glycosylphosphotransferase